MAPSTTAAALTSLTTGLPPAVHGLVGYRVHHAGAVMNLLHWRLAGRDMRQALPAGGFQPHPAFPGARGPVPVVTRVDFAATGFSAAHLGGAEQPGWYTASGLVVEIGRCLAAGAPWSTPITTASTGPATPSGWAPISTPSWPRWTDWWATCSTNCRPTPPWW